VNITKKVDSILGRIDQGAAQIEFEKIDGNLVAASANIAKITGDPTIPRAVADFSAAMQGVDALVKRLSAKVDPVADDIQGMAAAGRKALERLNETSEHLRTLTKPGSPARRDLDQALADVSEAAQAIRSLADFIERNPETIIQGRSKAPTQTVTPQDFARQMTFRALLLSVAALLSGCIIFDQKSEAVVFHQFAAPSTAPSTSGNAGLRPARPQSLRRSADPTSS
jgi:ABC-type transporter Mla subunit MlaD